MVRRKLGQGSKTAETQTGDTLPKRPSTSAFDVFLDRGLHSMFDSIKDEPIPEELLRIIQEDRKA